MDVSDSDTKAIFCTILSEWNRCKNKPNSEQKNIEFSVAYQPYLSPSPTKPEGVNNNYSCLNNNNTNI